MNDIFGMNVDTMIINYGYAVSVTNLCSHESKGLLPAFNYNTNEFISRERADDYAGLYSVIKAKETDVIYVSRVGFNDNNVPISSTVVMRVLAGGEVVGENQRVKLVAVTENINN